MLLVLGIKLCTSGLAASPLIHGSIILFQTYPRQRPNNKSKLLENNWFGLYHGYQADINELSVSFWSFTDKLWWERIKHIGKCHPSDGRLFILTIWYLSNFQIFNLYFFITKLQSQVLSVILVTLSPEVGLQKVVRSEHCLRSHLRPSFRGGQHCLRLNSWIMQIALWVATSRTEMNCRWETLRPRWSELSWYSLWL